VEPAQTCLLPNPAPSLGPACPEGELMGNLHESLINAKETQEQLTSLFHSSFNFCPGAFYKIMPLLDNPFLMTIL
jgi:hypothetical protein